MKKKIILLMCLIGAATQIDRVMRAGATTAVNVNTAVTPALASITTELNTYVANQYKVPASFKTALGSLNGSGLPTVCPPNPTITITITSATPRGAAASARTQTKTYSLATLYTAIKNVCNAVTSSPATNKTQNWVATNVESYNNAVTKINGLVSL